MSLPKNALYTNKIKSSYARNYQSQLQPQNGGGSFNQGETIIFNIATGNNLVMSSQDSIFRCSVNLSNAAECTASLDRGGVSNVIQRLRIFHGSTMLSDIDNYGNLFNMMTTLQQSTDSVSGGKMGILQGTGEQILNAAGAGDKAALEFSFPLLSILNSLNYVPLFALSGAPLRIEIQLVSSISKFIVSTTPLLKHSTKSLLTDVEMVINYMEISDSGMNIIKSSLNGQPLQWVVTDYRNYAYNAVLANGVEQQLSVPIPAKFNSLKSLFWSFRSHSTGDDTYYPSESCKFGLKEYTLRLGSQTMPTKAPNSTSQYFSELLRAIGTVSDLNHETSFNKNDYSANVPAVYTGEAVSSKSFYVGMDLESYSNCDNSSIYSGYNSSVDDIFYNPVFLPTANANIRVDTYALFDSLILIENGVATVQY